MKKRNDTINKKEEMKIYLEQNVRYICKKGVSTDDDNKKIP